MTGLNLEAFLRLLGADSTFWVSAGTIAALLGLGAWSVRGRTPVVSRCLALSLATHVGLMAYGGPQAARWLVADSRSEEAQRLRDLNEPAPVVALMQEHKTPPDARTNTQAQEASALDRPDSSPTADLVPIPLVDLPEPVAAEPIEQIPRELAAPLAVEAPEPPSTLPELDTAARELAPETSEPGERLPLERLDVVAVDVADGQRSAGDTALPEIEPHVPARALAGPSRNRRAVEPVASAPELMALPTAPTIPIEPAEPEHPLLTEELKDASDRPAVAMQELADQPVLAEPDLAPSRADGGPALAMAPRRSALPDRVPLIRSEGLTTGPPPPISGLEAKVGPRELPDIPEVYRSRMAPNRSAIALAGGATTASEEAVERSLKWLAAHQDIDGRWNAGSRRDTASRPLKGETSFTSHCPPGELCEGESYYYEADTAMTGLALLAFLGAGQTHETGPHADVVAKGLNFLVRAQKPDGDLRGSSVNVGMYCHAIASLALCEAYALTNDQVLRAPADRALKFLLNSRTADKVAWRYKPGDRFGGDTSILGWAVMVMKTAREVDLPVPEDAKQGALRWLKGVADGPAKGLAIYRPGEGYPVTPTMTAEAWACRQFLGVGGPGAASDEAAEYLLLHGPDRDPLNLYYWYYATLSMYQHGGESWVRWNNRVRDQLVRRQTRGGHADGSWDPALCKDKHDVLGGRIYTTALATLTLEVYYRYLRLYDSPSQPIPGSVQRAPGADAALRRVGVNPDDLVDPRPDRLGR